MKLFLDTSYFIELIGQRSMNVKEDFLVSLIEQENQFQLYYSTITLFELQASGAKRVSRNEIDVTSVLKGIQSMLFSKSIVQIGFQPSLIMQLSMELRNLHTDFIDCIIMASAILTSDILLTEDKPIKKLLRSTHGLTILKGFDVDNFQVLNSIEFSQEFLKN